MKSATLKLGIMPEGAGRTGSDWMSPVRQGHTDQQRPRDRLQWYKLDLLPDRVPIPKLPQNEQMEKTLYVGLITIPIAALSSVLKGYFQGLARVEETAWSQLIEQFLRIALVTWFLPYIVQQDSPAETAEQE